MPALRDLARDARGANLVEYLVLVGLLAIGALAGTRIFGEQLDGKARAQAACVASFECAQGDAASTGDPAPTSGEPTPQSGAAARVLSALSSKETLLVKADARVTPAALQAGQSPDVAARMDANIDQAISFRHRGRDVPENLLPTDHPVVEGNRADFLIDGDQVFSRILTDLSDAQSSIHISHFAVGNDKLGQEVGKILMDKARAGVEVRVMIDPAGSGNLLRVGKTEQMLDEWEKAGVQVIRNHHINPMRRAEMLNHVEHRKLYIVDGKVAYTGGMGIQEKYRSEWHDVMIRVEGEGARQMQVDFVKSWQHVGGRIDQKGGTDAELKKRFFPDAGRPGSDSLQGLSQIPGEAPRIREAYLREIAAAKKSFYVENPYFTDRRVLDALAAAAKRGVDVRVVLPGKTDNPITQWAARGEYDRLLKAGIRIYEYKGMTHAKVAVRDGEWATVGSSNLDSLSLNHLYEFNYQTESQRVVGDIERMIEKDMTQSREVRPGDVRGAQKYLYKLFDLPAISYFL
jgi:cardiolipin synthase